MSSITDKIQGAANQVVGKIKEELGHATGNKTLEGEGVAQNVKGHAQQTKGDVKDAVKSGIDKF